MQEIEKTLAELKLKLALVNRLLSNQIRGWTIAEVSEILHVSESKIYREIKAHRLTAYKFGSSTRIAHKELVRWNQGNDPLREIVTQLDILRSISTQVAPTIMASTPPIASADPRRR